MRRRGRIDENQPAIVDGLRKRGYKVLILSPLGNGTPDLLVSDGKDNRLIEVKNPDKPKADRQLTPDEDAWIQAWGGPVYVVETLEQALGVMTGYPVEVE